VPCPRLTSDTSHRLAPRLLAVLLGVDVHLRLVLQPTTSAGANCVPHAHCSGLVRLTTRAPFYGRRQLPVSARPAARAVALRGANLVACAIAEPPSEAPTGRTFTLNKGNKGAAPREAKPKREITVPWTDVVVGKQYKGVVVRLTARAGRLHLPGLALMWCAKTPRHGRPSSARSSTSAPTRTACVTSPSCRYVAPQKRTLRASNRKRAATPLVDDASQADLAARTLCSPLLRRH
jgi:hypothetical protein